MASKICTLLRLVWLQLKMGRIQHRRCWLLEQLAVEKEKLARCVKNMDRFETKLNPSREEEETLLICGHCEKTFTLEEASQMVNHCKDCHDPDMLDEDI